jgi:hypothetical protein
LIDVFHGLTTTSRALKLGHATLVFTTEFGPTYDDINDHFIDQVFYTADPTAIQVLLRRRTKGHVDAFPRQRLVVCLTDIVPS